MQQGATSVENKIFQALADPSRRAILESLTRGEAAVKDLTARFDISQPAVSQHLATLKDAGLVNGRREGRCVYYRVEPRGMKPLIDSVLLTEWLLPVVELKLEPGAAFTFKTQPYPGWDGIVNCRILESEAR